MVVRSRSIRRRFRYWQRYPRYGHRVDGANRAVGLETQLIDMTALGAGHIDRGDHFAFRQVRAPNI